MRKSRLVIVAGAVLVAAGAVAAVLTLAPAKTSGQPMPPTALVTTEMGVCVDGGADEIAIFFETDEAMRTAADALRDDDRIAELTTATKEEEYERFKEVFKDQPELIELVHPEAVPAAIRVAPADGVEVPDLSAQLADEITGEEDIQDDRCMLTPTSR